MFKHKWLLFVALAIGVFIAAPTVEALVSLPTTVGGGALLAGSTTTPNSLYTISTSTKGSVLWMAANGLPGWTSTSTLGFVGGASLTGGQTNYLPFWTSSTSLATSSLSYSTSTGAILLQPTTDTAGLFSINNASSSPIFQVSSLASSTQPTFLVASSSGTSMFAVTQNGNVGIGTTTPGSALTVIGQTALQAASTTALTVSGPLWVTGTPNFSGVSNCNGTSFMQFTSGAFACGIPAGGASLSGGINGYLTRWTSSSTVSTGISIDNGTVAGVNATSSTASFDVQGTGTLNPFNVASSTGTSLLTVAASGNVGIGLTSPNRLLQVYGDQSQGVAVVTRAPAGVAGVLAGSAYGTYFIQLHNASTTVSTFPQLSGPCQTFTVSTSTALATPSNVADICALRDTADNTGRIQIRPYNAGTPSIYSTLSLNGANSTAGIGTTSAVANFAVQSGPGGNVPIFEVATSSGASIFNVLPNGNVGVGMANPAYPLQVNIATSTGQGVTISDDGTYNGYPGVLSVYKHIVTPGDTLFTVGSSNLTNQFMIQDQQPVVFRNGINVNGVNVGTTASFKISSTNSNAQSIVIDDGGVNFPMTLQTVSPNAGIYLKPNFTQMVEASSTQGLLVNGSIGNGTLSVKGIAGINAMDVSSSSGTSLIRVLQNGNVGFGTTTPNAPLVMSSGANVTTGGVWTNASDRNLKENFTPLNPDDILNKIEQLPITEWNYKSEPSTIKHIGPVAQDFYAQFKLGGSDKSISTIDPAGVALLGIKALAARGYSATKRSAEENWQWIAIGLLALGLAYQQYQISKLKKHD